jgi:hypothetical protein
LRDACGLTGCAKRDANSGILAACTAVGGTEFCAQAGTMATAISSVAITAREIVRNSELRDCPLLRIGLSSCKFKKKVEPLAWWREEAGT